MGHFDRLPAFIERQRRQLQLVVQVGAEAPPGNCYSNMATLAFLIAAVLAALILPPPASGEVLIARGALEAREDSSVHHLMAWNGTAWGHVGSTSSEPDCGTNSHPTCVSAVTTDTDGVNGTTSLVVSGDFTALGSTAVKYVARKVGEQWQQFGTAQPGDYKSVFGHYLGDLVAWVHPESYLETYVNGSWQQVIPDAGFDKSVEAMIEFHMENSVKPDLFVAGFFNVPYYACVRFQTDTQKWKFVGKFSAAVLAFAIFRERLVIAGGFRTFDDVEVNGIALYAPNPEPLGTGISNGESVGAIYALMVHEDLLYAGGYFTSAGGKPAECVAYWDGNEWESLGMGVGLNPTNMVISIVACLGNIFIAGTFTEDKGSNITGVAQWNGVTWTTVGAGLDATSIPPYATLLCLQGV